ncbi:MAG: T9SS type A sorting domain-containing protein [Prevotellaceae bacterium]|jgi:hypothetical protein|nr:T9SS type A sorting domain-containing protein [Prevotellaceae bacterium]
MRKMKYVAFVFFVMVCVRISAQEMVVGLSENVLCGDKRVAALPATKSSAPLELPFMDDFSGGGRTSPDPRLWSKGASVFINDTYAINPPTVGVATFDPFDSRGKIYESASEFEFAADTLESASLNLAGEPGDSVSLSFYFQPQGYGDMPETRDSLVLEFYSPADARWRGVWRASVVSTTELETRNHLTGVARTATNDSLGSAFFRADLRIDNPAFLAAGFRFRFVNYASISVNQAFPGRSTATDHWHIDYVYLDRNRTVANENIPDIALSGMRKRLAMAFETVPASHLDAARNELFENPMKLELSYTNFGWGTRSVARSFSISPLYGGAGRTASYSAGAENIRNGTTIHLAHPVPLYEFAVTEDSAAFEVTSLIETDSELSDFRTALRRNDTSRTTYKFKDCYAYDDGTAEVGYGLFGSGSGSGMAAVAFSSYKTDTLRGVYLYFNRALNDANARHKFVLAVWDDAGGIPGELLHSEPATKPVFGDSLNLFVAYKFSEPIRIAASRRFYAGWMQTDEGFINIGMDCNRNSRDKLFYSMGQNWEPSVFNGSLMIRPIFCRADNFPPDAVEPAPDESSSTTGQFRAYPNPANGVIYIEEVNGDEPLGTSRIELYSLSGNLIKTYGNAVGSIDVSGVASGIYLMRVFDLKRRQLEVKRIIILN